MLNERDYVPIKLYFLKQAAGWIGPVVRGLPTPELAEMGLGAKGQAARRVQTGNGTHRDPGRKALVAREPIGVPGAQIKPGKMV